MFLAGPARTQGPGGIARAPRRLAFPHEQARVGEWRARPRAAAVHQEQRRVLARRGRRTIRQTRPVPAIHQDPAFPPLLGFRCRHGRRHQAFARDGRQGHGSDGALVVPHRRALEFRTVLGQRRDLGHLQAGAEIGVLDAAQEGARIARIRLVGRDARQRAQPGAHRVPRQTAVVREIERSLRRAASRLAGDEERVAGPLRRRGGRHGLARHRHDGRDRDAFPRPFRLAGPRVRAADVLAVREPPGAVLRRVVHAPERPHALGEMRVEVAVEEASPAVGLRLPPQPWSMS